MIVRARSPYIIFINEVGQTSGKLELRIWKKGETKPTLPTYSFTKSIPSATQTKLTFNISPYLKDFISNELNDVDTWYCYFECRLFSNNVELTAQKKEGYHVSTLFNSSLIKSFKYGEILKVNFVCVALGIDFVNE